MSVKAKTSLFRDLLYLREVIIYRQISAAAEKNGIKSSNLSRIVKNVEQHTGKQMFYRNSHGLTPTAEALKFADIIEELDNILKRLKLMIDQSSSTHELKLYIPENVELKCLDTFMQENKVNIQICTLEQNADVIISYTRPDKADEMISVKNTLGSGVQQTIWICAANSNLPLKLAQFIISQIHFQ